LFYILIIVTFETNLRIIKLMNNLNTQNPNQLEYLNKLIKITVLGGIRIDGLDRMRVTLKIQSTEVESLAVRHNLDLYNDTQVEKLIRKTATKLEIGTSVIEASINELIEALEKYRLEQMENTDQKPQTKQLTEKEKSEALQLLQSQNLLTTTNELIGQSGIIGEETNRLIMYLIFTSRKREQPLHIISLGSSGTGKTHLQESIGNLIPEEEKTEITTLSENAFYYFGQQELKHKLILIEDLDGAESALYPIRELQSKKKISKKIAFKNTKGETKTTNITVEGPVCISGCTTKESVYEDNANRSFLIYLDETTAQDDKIMNYQKLVSANKIDIEQQLKAKAVLQNSQYLLKSIKVINPYAELVELPKEVLKPRRTNAHYLQFIELITHYHQHQRDIKHDEETGEEYIETTIEDIKNANELIKEILIRKADILTGNSRNQLETFKKSLKNKGETFTNIRLRTTLKIAKTTAQRYLDTWLEVGIISKIQDKETQTHYYQISNETEYQNLEKEIDRILNKIIETISNRPTDPPPTHNTIKPVKPNTTKGKT
jgi:predicted transcriptional regulator